MTYISYLTKLYSSHLTYSNICINIFNKNLRTILCYKLVIFQMKIDLKFICIEWIKLHQSIINS